MQGVYKRTKPAWNKGIPCRPETKIKLSLKIAGRKAHWMVGNSYGKAQIGQKRPGVGGRKVGSIAWNKGLKGFNSGAKNGKWVDDRSLIKLDKERGGPLHKQWSMAVKSRDGWKCKIANTDCQKQLEAHHILSWKNHPELRYVLNNGIALCKLHHPRKRLDEVTLAPLFTSLVAPAKQ